MSDKIIIINGNKIKEYKLHDYRSDKYTKNIKITICNNDLNFIYGLYDKINSRGCDYKIKFIMSTQPNFSLDNPSIMDIHTLDNCVIINLLIDNISQYERVS